MKNSTSGQTRPLAKMLRPLPLLRGGSLIFLASPRSRGGTEGGEFLTFARGLLTPGALAPRMFTAGLLAWQPSFQQFWAIQSTVPHRTGQRLLRQGVLSQPSNLNLDAWKQSAGVFPRRLDTLVAILCSARERPSKPRSS